MNTLFKPPMMEGVSPSKIYLEKFCDKAKTPALIFDFFCQKFPHITIDEWQRRFDEGLVFWDDGMPVRADEPYVYGRSVYYYRFLASEVVVPFEHEVIFENQEFMVVDKPHFLTVTPSGDYVKQTLLTRLKHQTNNPDLSPIHRLDKETAGLILISKNPKTRSLYQSLFHTQDIKKIYHAIAPINHELTFPLDLHLHLTRGDPFYIMQVKSEKPNSHTRMTLIKTQGDWAKYELEPSTGKLHQLRVHLNHLGIAIKNDPYYPCVRHKATNDFTLPLQLLAYSLCFIDPMTGRECFFSSNRTLEF